MKFVHGSQIPYYFNFNIHSIPTRTGQKLLTVYDRVLPHKTHVVEGKTTRGSES